MSHVRTVRFDHTALAVEDAEATLRWLRRHMGVVVIAGERLDEFKFVSSHVGAPNEGAILELLDAEAGHPNSFVRRFLNRSGEGVHHLSFLVSELESVIEEVRALGIDVVKIDLSYPPWREAFLMPDELHGVVIQLASSTLTFPTYDDLEAGRRSSPEQVPHTVTGRDRLWWADASKEPIQTTAELRGTVLVTSDPELSRKLFEGVLRSAAKENPDGSIEHRWEGGRLVVEPGETAGVRLLEFAGGEDDQLLVGGAQFVRVPR